MFHTIKCLLITCFLTCSLWSCAQDKTKLSYDYDKIGGHPRLLLKQGDEEVIRASLQRNPEFQRIDTYIRQVSEELFDEPTLVFKKEGKRLLAISRRALTRLYYLSYSYRMTGDTRYLQRAEDELKAVCAFESWNPSHFLDVGEMAMGVAIAYDWLYDGLTDDTRKLVRQAIIEKAFKPSYVSGDNLFLTRHNNWNPVCNGGLVYAALAIFEDEKEQATAIIERALESTKLPLETYAPDGNYPEGPGYWNYGTTFQVMFFAALESALGSELGLSNAPGFNSSAYYMLYAVGPSGYYFNYYDGGRAVAPSSALFWFAEKEQDPALIYQEIPLIRKGGYTKKINSDEHRFLPNALVFGKNLTLSEIKPPSGNTYTGHGMTPISIVRTNWKDGEGKYLGIKGGRAGDPHGHMDQGTFVYDVGKFRWAMDFGLQSYITLESEGVDLWNMSQNSQRWDIFRYNNLNHNTLTINNQRHNVEGKSEIIETYDKGRELGAKVDLTPALNLNNELKRATRKAVIVDESFLKIEDSIETNTDPVDLRWNMVTPASAEIMSKNTIRLSQQGKDMILTVDSEVPFKLTIRPSENPREYKSEFGNYKYGDYNQHNKGTVMVGFDSTVPTNTTVKYTVTLIESL
ncbi:heparinase II/III family protein [Sphingobacterium sp. DN00404]|uniref:Heparinase II/III family protein n=1 Tax=Sphingobacterium micropteri TaxID=2763501 RepID=A0ABR7YPW8_9SPHI|nr:heparinase II/III family protein [Sphingobacterium micropteri]